MYVVFAKQEDEYDSPRHTKFLGLFSSLELAEEFVNLHNRRNYGNNYDFYIYLTEEDEIDTDMCIDEEEAMYISAYKPPPTPYIPPPRPSMVEVVTTISDYAAAAARRRARKN